MFIEPPPTIVSAVLNAAGEFEVVRRKAPVMHTMQAVAGVYCDPQPDAVWKEVYAAVDGRVKLVRTVWGQHTPRRTVPESITFPDES